ncbi:MAG: cytochrome P450 [Acidimicrobiales bacterium]
MSHDGPVQSWAEDFDIFDRGFVADPYPVWSELRSGGCPVAHSDRWGGAYMPTRYEDVAAIAHDTEHFSSVQVSVTEQALPDGRHPRTPPITSDPPDHTWARRLLLPFFSPKVVERYEAVTRRLAGELIDRFRADGRADAAADYAQQIPPRIIAEILGIPVERSDEFTEWVRGTLEFGAQDPELREHYRLILVDFFRSTVAQRRAEIDAGRPGQDIITFLLQQHSPDGEPLRDGFAVNVCTLLLVAGIDTTWSSIGSALWHLGQHPEDCARLAADVAAARARGAKPELLPIAVEELLRAYSPVTMARIVKEDVEVAGCPMHAGERVLLTFPAANRDPAVFPDAEKVVIDREVNRHIAFGVGIHRCAGSNLARMEMNVALEEWLARIPDYRLADPAAVTWAGGQVRGPRSLPVEWT